MPRAKKGSMQTRKVSTKLRKATQKLRKVTQPAASKQPVASKPKSVTPSGLITKMRAVALEAANANRITLNQVPVKLNIGLLLERPHLFGLSKPETQLEIQQTLRQMHLANFHLAPPVNGALRRLVLEDAGHPSVVLKSWHLHLEGFPEGDRFFVRRQVTRDGRILTRFYHEANPRHTMDIEGTLPDIVRRYMLKPSK